MTISNNIKQVTAEIEEFRSKYKILQPVNLLAVSKTKPYESVMEAYNAGQRRFGENYAQEGCEKIERANAEHIPDIEWFFIGPIQSNKTKMIAEHFDWVLSCDRSKIVTRLNEQRPFHKGKLKVCIQVNISEEEQKSGVYTESEIMDLAAFIAKQPNLEFRGLMAIALNTSEPATLKDEFTRMNILYQKLKSIYPTVDTLSIGMTADMEIAVECGSNLVRIGTRIFGARNYNK
ncbi:MAG: YggS family pyridoxal phosphate-dependent enzyme [Succinivibrionaceae bacterium]|nr:YggS family pyridoxal phosphate-dependent enzyme [Succinivibrionaceae bacterium]